MKSVEVCVSGLFFYISIRCCGDVCPDRRSDLKPEDHQLVTVADLEL